MIDDKVMESYFNDYENRKISTKELLKKLNNIGLSRKTKSLLSEGQKGLWAIQNMDKQNTSYNIPICFRFQKKENLNLFRKAVEFIWKQYPILKSTIIEESGKLYQVIDTAMLLSYEVMQIENKDDFEMTAYIKEIANHPFTLNEGPLFRVQVLESPNNQTVLVNIHHIICDGTSSVILTKALLHAYQQLVEQKEPKLVDRKDSYSDFVDWETTMLSGRRGKEHSEFWKQQFQGELTATELMPDLSESKQSGAIGDMFQLLLSSEIKKKIKAFANAQRISLPSFFLSVLNIFLYQCTNQSDITVGVASMGRPEERFESLLGYFINMIPIRSQIKESDKFQDYARELQNKMLDCLDHADYPCTYIIKDRRKERNVDTSPIFKVAYYYQNFLESDFVSSLKKYETMFNIKFLSAIHQKGEYDFVLEVLEEENGILLSIKYNEMMYSRGLMEHYAKNIAALSEKLAENPDKEIQKYPLISDEEKNKILFDWNDTEITYPNTKMVHELFEEQADANPDRIAVVYENESLTYKQLNEKSEKLAIYLQSIGVVADTLVGICVERSLDMIVGLLAILKAGGAYVPLDPEYPNERVEYMIENSNINIILAQSAMKQKKGYLNTKELCTIFMDAEMDTLNITGSLSHKVGKRNLAYVLYTSGSTGKPKGVMIPHEALTNFLLQMADIPGFGEDDTLLAVTTFCFDIAGLELYLPLIKGAKYYICSTEKKKDIEKLKKEIQRVKPTVMQATPATWMALNLVGWRNEEHVKILCGGEALPKKLRKYFMESNSEVWNMFGPTETTIWSTMKRIEEGEEITIGKPMANTQVYILNKNNMPVPVGVPGELYIGGTGLSRGYYNREDLTKERFIANPFIVGAKMYKTGDVAKWTSNGEINFIGRADNQVKIHGFRIELSEIETRMNEYDQIEQSAVIVSERDGNRQLKAFFVGKNKDTNQKVDLKQLRTYLKNNLPVYMMPNLFVQIDMLPITPNGKINRLELGKYKEHSKDNEKETETKNKPVETIDLKQIQATLLEFWKMIIGNDDIQINDGFFEAGGDSILAVLIVEKIKEYYKCDIKVTHLFEYSNIANLSEFIAEELSKENKLVSVKNSMKAQAEQKEEDELDAYEDCVAIIGLSCQFPGAKNADEFWDNLINNRECANRLTKEQLIEMNIPKGLIENKRFVPIRLSIEGKELFDNEFFSISPKDAENMNPQMRLLLENSWKAVEDAGYVSKTIPNTGVYMSSSNNSYLTSGGMQNYGLIDSSESYVKWLMSQTGTVPTMISYRLGFTGPSFAVHSNCSSALVGLSLAYQNIKAGEIDYALVGASTIHSKNNAGYLYVPGMNFSKDGHIRAFDAKADGMIGGEGVAVIMLKNAKKAIKDHDHVYAMLKGITVSNDGTEKVGFYAPSIKGQSYAIEKMIEKTGINPETISYVEAHGTGTKLGDPIEFKALKEVYEKYTDKKQFCGIGSVKTNVGHLDTAAGLAGCIKLALSLKNRKIPATINYSEANPEINFEDSPFFMTNKVIELEESIRPARVSLSSFGIGGTNVHTLLEEYKENEEKNLYSNNKCIIPVSAKNEERLNVYVKNIYEYLLTRQGESLDLQDIAYTLQTGREAMESRTIFCVNSIAELKEKMNIYLNGGQSVIDEAVDELLVNMQKIWMAGKPVDWNSLYTEQAKPKKVSLPTYPFEEKRFWKEEEEIKKQSTMTNSVAAKKVHYLLDENTSSFMQQSYTTRFTGEEFFLKDHVINNKLVLPGVVYIEMARAAGQDAIRGNIIGIKNVVWPRPITVEQPRDVRVILDNKHPNQLSYRIVTMENENEVVHSQGKLLYQDKAAGLSDRKIPNQVFQEQACRKRCNVYISKRDFYQSSLASVYQYGATFQPIKEMFFNDTESLAYLEIPSERYHDFEDFKLHPSILEGCLQSITGLLYRVDQTPFMPYTIEKIDIYNHFSKKCLAYATYSDEKTSHEQFRKFNIKLYDMEGRLLASIRNYTIRKIPSNTTNVTEPVNKQDMQMYHYVWKKNNKKMMNGRSKVGSLLIFDNDKILAQEFRYANDITYVLSGNKFRECQNGVYEIATSDEESYFKLFDELRRRGKLPNQIVYKWTYIGNSTGENVRTAFYAMLHIARALVKLKIRDKVKLLYLYQDENNHEAVMNDALSGFVKTLQMEHPNLYFRIIKIKGIQYSIKDLIESELQVDDTNTVYYQDNTRYMEQLIRDDVKHLDSKVPFKERGTYLITGGMGKIGLSLARYLASNFRANLILTGRSVLDAKKQENLEELRMLGANVSYISVDMSKRKDVMRMKEQIKDQFTTIQGIISCAGVVRDSFIINKTMLQIEEVLRAKIDATIIMDEVMKDEKLDFFLLFSSISHLGNIGQADYAVANSFLNSFASYRKKLCMERERYGKTVSINWPIWEQGGMHMETAVLERQKERTGVYPLPTQVGLEAIRNSLMQENDTVLILYGEGKKMQKFVSHLNSREDQMGEKEIEVKSEMNQKELIESVMTFLQNTAEELIKVNDLNIDKDLSECGFDSISNTDYTNKINDYYGLEVMPTIFFELEMPTVRALCNYLIKNYSDELSSFYGQSSNEMDSFEAKEEIVDNKYIVEQATSNKDVLDKVLGYLSQTIETLQKIDHVDIDKNMNLYGFDSISNTELCNLINDNYDIDLMPTIFFELEEATVRKLASYICNQYSKKMELFYKEERVTLKEEEAVLYDVNEEEEVVQLFHTNTPVNDAFEDAVAIIGMDGAFPQSENLHEFWNKIEQGDTLITEIPTERFDYHDFDDPCMKWGAFMKNVSFFDADYFGMSKQEAEVLDPQHRMFIQTTWNTIEDAGYKPSYLSGTDTGIFVGIGTQDYTEIVEKNLAEFNPYALTGRSPFMMPNRISSLLNIHGPSEAIDTACSSSLVAIHKAAEAVKNGTCNMAIAGGVNLILSPLVHKAFSTAGMLSKTGKCSVFDKDADGTVRGEGVGAILLKRLDNAKRDGDHIYAVIRSSGENHKGKSASLTAPNAIAEKELIKSVYEKAHINPSSVNYIEVHSTGTKLGDPVEITGLKNAFTELSQIYGVRLEANSCAISSVKPIIGHLEAAAGIVSVLKVILSLQHKKILKVSNFKELNPYINLEDSPFYINKSNCQWERIDSNVPRRAGVSAFGFGGVNAHVLIEEYMEDAKEESYNHKDNLKASCICLSGKTKEALEKQVRMLLESIEENQFMDDDLVDIAYTLQTGREEFEERVGFTVRTIEQLKEKLDAFISQKKSYGSKIFYGRVVENNNLLLLLNKNNMVDDIVEPLISSNQMDKLVELWVNGVSINWRKLYIYRKVKKVSLPVYPFEQKRYWVELKDEKKETNKFEIQLENPIVQGEPSKVVMGVLAQMLGVKADEIDKNDSTSELGIDSIILMQLLRKVQIINPKVDFESLYQCGTIEDILNIVNSNDNRQKETENQESLENKKDENDTNKIMSMVYGTGVQNDEYIVLQKYPELIKMNHSSEGRPVFWLHGGFGGVEVYRLIASEFERPFYGIQARGYMSEDEPIEGLEEMAAYYVKIIELIQPNGPYDLGGLSLGGILAYEVCRQLQLKGQKVNSIVMLESIYVDEIMRTEWSNISTVNLKKDQMFRASNLLLAFSTDTELNLVTESEMKTDVSDDEFLEQLVQISQARGIHKSSEQLKKLIIGFQKIINVLDTGTTFYEAKNLTNQDDVQCYYFCNPEGTLFGQSEEYFRLVDKGRSYDFAYFAKMWKDKMPKLETIEIHSSNHMTILTETEPKQIIVDLCKKLYAK